MTLEDILEVLFFTHDTPLSLTEVKEFLERDPSFGQVSEEALLKAIAHLQKRYEGHAVELKPIAKGYQLFTKPQYGEMLTRWKDAQRERKISRALLEVLAIIAYNQPITKAQIENLRNASADHALQKLLEQGLIATAGRAPLPGKPLLYKTTDLLLERLGIASLAQLPKLEEI
ncbi:MAG: SMC-Scp complex subunit ScpB [Bacteroidia bacterium]